MIISSEQIFFSFFTNSPCFLSGMVSQMWSTHHRFQVLCLQKQVLSLLSRFRICGLRIVRFWNYYLYRGYNRKSILLPRFFLCNLIISLLFLDDFNVNHRLIRDLDPLLLLLRFERLPGFILRPSHHRLY